MGIINRDFMLNTKTARKLYEEFAENLPIIDYHCHLQPEKNCLGLSVYGHLRFVFGRRPLQMASNAQFWY